MAEKMNLFAILSLVFAFLFPPLGLVFGIIALVQIKKSREDGKGIAIAGIIISSFFTLWMLIMILGIIGYFFVGLARVLI